MDKRILVYAFNGLLSNKKECAIDTCCNMEKSQNNYTVEKKPDKKDAYCMISFI